MRKLLIVLCMIIPSVIFARPDVDLSSFNKHMLENMDKVIEDNPEIYETKTLGREPASVKPDPRKISPTEKLDNFDPQGNAPKSW